MNINLMLIRLITGLIIILICLPIHEFAHGFAASRLGDPTPKMQGRLTLNPLKHLDPLGSIFMLASAFSGIGFGWAKPVMTNPSYFKNPKTGMAITAAAGPLANLLMAWISMIIFKIFMYIDPVESNLIISYITGFLAQMVLLNIGLAIFNLLPIPPFDGSRIALLFLPEKYYFKIMRYERIIMSAMMIAIIFGVLDRPLSVLNSLGLKLMDFFTGFVDTFALAVL